MGVPGMSLGHYNATAIPNAGERRLVDELAHTLAAHESFTCAACTHGLAHDNVLHPNGRDVTWTVGVHCRRCLSAFYCSEDCKAQASFVHWYVCWLHPGYLHAADGQDAGHAPRRPNSPVPAPPVVVKIEDDDSDNPSRNQVHIAELIELSDSDHEPLVPESPVFGSPP